MPQDRCLTPSSTPRAVQARQQETPIWSESNILTRLFTIRGPILALVLVLNVQPPIRSDPAAPGLRNAYLE